MVTNGQKVTRKFFAILLFSLPETIYDVLGTPTALQLIVAVYAELDIGADQHRLAPGLSARSTRRPAIRF